MAAGAQPARSATKHATSSEAVNLAQHSPSAGCSRPLDPTQGRGQSLPGQLPWQTSTMAARVAPPSPAAFSAWKLAILRDVALLILDSSSCTHCE